MNRHELKTAERDIDFKLPTPLGSDSSVPKFFDTRYRFDIGAWIAGLLRYKSSITGRDYSDFNAMREEERLLLEDQRRSMLTRFRIEAGTHPLIRTKH